MGAGLKVDEAGFAGERTLTPWSHSPGMETAGDFFALGPSQDRVHQDQGAKHLRIKLSRGERIYFGGYGVIKVVNGILSVLGARIGTQDPPLPFYSPKSSSLLYFSPYLEVDSVEFIVSELENGPITLDEGDPSLKSMFMFSVRSFPHC